jgi:hypothetical protein
MQGAFVFAAPHRPCNMNCLTALKATGSSSFEGISAVIILSISAGVGYLLQACNHKRMCACGSPLFWNFIVYMVGNLEDKINMH